MYALPKAALVMAVLIVLMYVYLPMRGPALSCEVEMGGHHV